MPREKQVSTSYPEINSQDGATSWSWAANLKPGDRIHFTVLEDGTIIVRVKNRSIGDISFKPPRAKQVSIAQMNR
jgi:hypothetical protein